MHKVPCVYHCQTRIRRSNIAPIQRQPRAFRPIPASAVLDIEIQDDVCLFISLIHGILGEVYSDVFMESRFRGTDRDVDHIA